MALSISPYITNQPQNTFLLNSQGFVQGVALDDTPSRMWLKGGTLLSTQTLPMWGGVPITELINQMGTNSEGTGPVVARSTTQANTTGWAVFNQAHSMVIGSGNTVPISSAREYVSFYSNGSNARIAVQCDTSITGLAGTTTVAVESLGGLLYWDTTNFLLTTTSSSNVQLPTTYKLLSINTNSKIVSWTSPNATWATGAVAILQI